MFRLGIPVEEVELKEGVEEGPQALQERLCESLGIHASSIKLYRLQPLLEEDEDSEGEQDIVGVIQDSGLSYRYVTDTMNENADLRSRLDRTVQALLEIQSALEREEKRNAAAATATPQVIVQAPQEQEPQEEGEEEREEDEGGEGVDVPLSRKVARLRSQLKTSTRIRQQGFQMLQVLQQEFASLAQQLA